MSGQGTQRVRPSRNPSPSTKQGPMKATLTFSLMQGSPTRANGRKISPSSSPTPQKNSDGHRVKNRRSPDHRNSPERRSPGSPCSFKIERPKPVRLQTSPGTGSSAIRRTGSLDTIAGQYITGQWPRFQSTTSSFVADKWTQTPEEWDDQGNDKKKKGHKRSASLGNGDQLKELQLIKQRLQRSKEGNRQSTSINQRQSPIHGNHAALTNPPTATTITKPLAIPVSNIPKSGVPRIRGSVEGLNQEIEKLVLKQISGIEYEEESRTQEPTDGHRAPVIELLRGSSTRSVDTQTPLGTNEDSGNSSGGNSRSQSISPSFPIIPGQMDNSRPSSRSESNESAKEVAENKPEKVEIETSSPDPSNKYAASPRPNKSYAFVREPPDGCEKVPSLDEQKKAPPVKEPLLFCSLGGTDKFVLKPSAGSAFCPLKYPATTPELLVSTVTDPPNHTTIASQ